MMLDGTMCEGCGEYIGSDAAIRSIAPQSARGTGAYHGTRIFSLSTDARSVGRGSSPALA